MNEYTDDRIPGFQLHEVSKNRYVATLGVHGNLTWGEFYWGAVRTGRHGKIKNVTNVETAKKGVIEYLQAIPV